MSSYRLYYFSGIFIGISTVAVADQIGGETLFNMMWAISFAFFLAAIFLDLSKSEKA